jgi:hypothetical protein
MTMCASAYDVTHKVFADVEMRRFNVDAKLARLAGS